MYKAVGRWAFRRQRWWIREQQCTVEARTSCWAVALMLAITCISRTLSPVKSIIPLLPNVFWGVHPFWSCTLLDIQVVANIYPMAQHDVCAFMVHHSSRIHHWYTILHLSIIGTLLFTYPSLVHYSSRIHHWYSTLHLSIIGTLLFTYPSLVHYSSRIHHWYTALHVSIIGTLLFMCPSSMSPNSPTANGLVQALSSPNRQTPW